MTRIAKHTVAMTVALFITLVSFHQVVAVPPQATTVATLVA